MRPKADRHEAGPEEPLPAVQEDETRNTLEDSITERFIRQVDSRLNRTITKLEWEKERALTALDKKVAVIVSGATPDCRDEVRRALEVLQDFAKQHVEGVSEEALACLRSDSRLSQDLAIEMDAEMTEQHTAEITELQNQLEKAQQAGEVSGEPTTEPQAGHVGRGASNMFSRTSTSGSSTKSFAELFGNAERPRRAAGESSRRPPQPTARGSFKSSQDQSNSRSSMWNRGAKHVGSANLEEIRSESGPKTEVPLDPKELEATDYEHLDPMMRSLLEAGDDLHREFMEDASKAGTEEWQGEADEYVDLQQQLDQTMSQLNKQKSMMIQKDDLINELYEEIAKLQDSNQSLTPKQESMAYAPSAGTPIASQFGRLTSVTSFPVNSATGSPRASNPAWISMWLPKTVRVQMDRVQQAVKRCVAEEAACSEKMLKLGRGKQTIMEKDCLTARKSSSEKHRQDFTQTMAFLDELSRYSKKSQNCLADELSGMELESASGLNSLTTPTKMPTPDASNSEPGTPASVVTKKLASESGPSGSRGQDASTSPKEPASPPKAASPTGETQGSSRSPKNQDTTPKVPSPLAESHTPPAGNTTPPASNTAPAEGSNERVRELDDPESATQTMVGMIDSGVLGVWSLLVHLGLIAMTHAGAWIRVCKYLFRIFMYVMNQISRAVRMVWRFGRDAGEEPPAPMFPKMPSPECFIVVMYYCVAFLTFQVYMACQRERNIWSEANGLTRKYGLERSRSQSRWLIYGVDGNLVVGRKDIEKFFKLIYMLGMGTLQHLSKYAYGTP